MTAARAAAIAFVSCLMLCSAPALGQATTRSGDPATGWRPAGCPVPTPSQAAASAPGAPTDVHALPGNGSVTVAWCPPATGQGSVVSYTVTSSGGQQYTAEVPNSYVIAGGLTNGDPYSFTVHANTASGASGPSASSRRAAPEPIPGPRDVLLGPPQSVSYDQYSLMIGGKRTFIYAAEFDPWRLPSPSLWRDRLQKIKADGYNAVTPYFDWDYSSPAPGVYDFSGVRDMNEFLNLAQEVGLYVIARPGPYINAETDGGGFPGWLVTQSGTARTDSASSADFVAASDQWLSEIDPIIAAHQITRGGDVILYQVENELFHSDASTDAYMAELEAKARADGIKVPLTGNSSDTFEGTSANPDIPGYDSYPLGFNCADPNGFGNPPTFSAEPRVPLMLPEFQGGSYDAWGGSGYANCYALTGTDFENVFYKSNLADGVTIQSNYMGVGGTNWGWLPAPFMYTSYDYGAAIQETGEIGTPSDPNTIPNSKYGENKLIGDFIQAAPSLTETDPVAAPPLDNPAVTAMARINPDDGTQFIYLRQADASSTTTVSTHMALNTDETSGYTYDDTSPSLDYAGTGWSHVSDQSYTGGDYDKTESFSDTTGDSVSVTFTGTAVQWIAPTASNHGIADVSLDGRQTTVDGYSPGTNFQQVEYSVSGLADTTHTLTISVSGQKNPASSGTYVSIDAINLPTAAQAADYYPVVPQQGAITLQGRDAKLLLANDSFDGQQLMYSTSELMTQAQIGNQAVALLYGPAGTGGETVLRYSSQPTVKVLSGSVPSTWDATRDDLRLDYVHHGLAEVQISGGGRPPLLLLLAQKTVAEEFWPETTAAGPALVRGSYLVRTAQSRGSTLALTGDTSRAGKLTVWAPPQIGGVSWNGRPVSTSARRDGSLSGSVGGPPPVTLPALGNWRFSFETPEAQPGYDDSSWVLADHPVTTNPTKPVTTPVLYADDYGFHTGFVWYRGHFATGSETGINLTVGGGTHGAFSVWLNGAFLGSDTAGGDQTQMSFPFPAAALRPGKDNVVAVLTQSSGHDEDGVYGPAPSDAQKAPRGLLGAALEGSSTPVTWRLQGAQGGENLQDPVRGPMNATGLYGTNRGWDLPGYPDAGWQPVSLPDSWSGRGLPPGIGWYRTTFNLDLPRQSYVPVAVQIDGPGPGPGSSGADYRAFIFVNGWLMGQYDNKLGPQHRFYVPAGILNQNGSNTLAIAVWGLDQAGGGLDHVSLVALGDQSGGVPVQPVFSPGWNPSVYGRPSTPSPTLGVISSSALVNPSQASTVKAVLSNPGRVPLRDATISLTVPSGWMVAPSGSDSVGTVAPGGSATATFHVTAPGSGSSTPGPVDLVAKATYDVLGRPESLLGTAQLQVPFTSLAASFNNTGITDNSDTNPSPGFEGFDGEGTTYSAQGLAAAGLATGATVSAGGLSFTWPNAPSAQPDNTMAEGQIIRVSGSGSELGFLAAANNSAESGTGTVYYTDGSTSTFTLEVGNFWYASGQSGNPVNDQVASVNYANYPTGSSGHTIYVFEQSVPIDSGKAVEAVALPALGSVQGYNPALHIFALDVGG